MPAAEPPNRSRELTLVEELAWLALDEKTGKTLPLPVHALGYGLAGALILDLSLARRIDTDLASLTVISPAPTGDSLLDSWLSYFQASPQPRSVMYWLRDLARREDEIHRAALNRLIERGLLRREKNRLFWETSALRYPTVDSTGRTEVRARLTRLIQGSDLPAPRDAILLSLIYGCHLAGHFFAGLDLKPLKKRLETLAGTDLVGREVSAATVTSVDVVGRALSEMPVNL